MLREKQIEEMAKDLCNVCERINDCKFVGHCLHVRCVARDMYDNKGYRKTSEVARDIFEEIERILSLNYCCCLPQGVTEHYEYYEGDVAKDIVELKKKYTGEKEDEQIH